MKSRKSTIGTLLRKWAAETFTEASSTDEDPASVDCCSRKKQLCEMSPGDLVIRDTSGGTSTDLSDAVIGVFLGLVPHGHEFFSLHYTTAEILLHGKVKFLYVENFRVIQTFASVVGVNRHAA